jgi:hypothetical protein
LRLLTTVALVLGLLGLTACQNTAGRPPAANTAAIDHAAEARKAFDAREWAAAAPHFRAAIEAAPDDLTLHFGLAISASWLSLLEEATVEFTWVVAHAPSGSDEARAAREWLAGATRPANATAAADATDDPKAGDAAIEGLVTWEGPDQSPEVLRRSQLHLNGLPDGPTKGLSYYVRTDKEGRYQFSRIKAGAYKLTDAVAGTPKWNLKITVGSGESLQLNLSTQNSVSQRNDFPPAGS